LAESFFRGSEFDLFFAKNKSNSLPLKKSIQFTIYTPNC